MSLDGPCSDGDTVVDVQTTYGTEPDLWGWRITIERTDTGVLVRHNNVPPADGDLGGDV